MQFFKNIKCEQQDDGSFILYIRVSDMIVHQLHLDATQMEYLINSYREAK